MSHTLFIFSFWHSFYLTLLSCSQDPTWSCYNLAQCWAPFSLRPPPAAGKAISNAVLRFPLVDSEMPQVTLMTGNASVVWFCVCLVCWGFWVWLFGVFFWGGRGCLVFWVWGFGLFVFFLKPPPKIQSKGHQELILFHTAVLIPKLSIGRWSVPYRSIEWVLHLRLFPWFFWCVMFYGDSGWHSQDKCQDLIVISFDNISSKIGHEKQYFWPCTFLRSESAQDYTAICQK